MAENLWQPPIPPDHLRKRILKATERGQRSGTLLPIATTFVEIEDQGIPFVVRIVDNIRRKREAKLEQGKINADPFLPYEQELYVGDISDSHVAVLNKFNVIDLHLLIVTRAFEHQESLLTVGDFYALWRCMRELDALGFYNGGVEAGASQEHKHLQVAPFPITKGRQGVPVDAVIQPALSAGRSTVEAFPFTHAVAACPASWCEEPHVAACECHAQYQALMAATGLDCRPGSVRQPAPYNMLVTRSWMMIVPRTHEHFESMSINAIGYAGGLLVRNEAELERVREVGPIRIIAEGGCTEGRKELGREWRERRNGARRPFIKGT